MKLTQGQTEIIRALQLPGNQTLIKHRATGVTYALSYFVLDSIKKQTKFLYIGKNNNVTHFFKKSLEEMSWDFPEHMYMGDIKAAVVFAEASTALNYARGYSFDVIIFDEFVPEHQLYVELIPSLMNKKGKMLTVLSVEQDRPELRPWRSM